jgi:hypothetical protein
VWFSSILLHIFRPSSELADYTRALRRAIELALPYRVFLGMLAGGAQAEEPFFLQHAQPNALYAFITVILRVCRLLRFFATALQ